jgi:N-acetylglutamate synthase-like GNAT family acetyltransferase
MPIIPVQSGEDEQRLDLLLWEVLWQPLGFPRDVRDSFGIEGEQIVFAAREEEKMTGGLVAVMTSPSDIELRHIAVRPEARNRGTGGRLVGALVEEASRRGCRRLLVVSRNTSAGFFRKLAFQPAPVAAPEHPDFSMHGIAFIIMEKAV